MNYTLTHLDDGNEDLIVTSDGLSYAVDSTHPRWWKIIDLVAKDDSRVVDIFVMDPQRGQSGSTLEPFEVLDDTCNDPDCLGCYGDPSGNHWIDDLTDEELYAMNVDNLTTAGIVPCDDPECSLCYPPLAPDEQARAEVNAHLNHHSVDTSASQEALFEQEKGAHILLDQYEAPLYDDETGLLLTVNGRMRGCLADLWERAEMAEYSNKLGKTQSVKDLREELDYAWTRFWNLADELVTTEGEVDRWQDRAIWLEAACKNYASHAWNDIKRALDL
jgi:hypothetical protein